MLALARTPGRTPRTHFDLQEKQMNAMKTTMALGLILAGTLLVGCQQPKMTWEQMWEQPDRPAELDVLNQFVGTWQQTAHMECKFIEGPYDGTGVGTAKWDADGWALVWHFDYNAPDGSVMRGVETWVWDAKAKKYRTYALDNYGYMMQGTAKYDADTRTFKSSWKGRNLLEGKTTKGSGTMRFIDDNTVEWDFSMWDGWHLVKIMEMSGTMTRN
jgi:hypothetical protein